VNCYNIQYGEYLDTRDNRIILMYDSSCRKIGSLNGVTIEFKVKGYRTYKYIKSYNSDEIEKYVQPTLKHKLDLLLVS